MHWLTIHDWVKKVWRFQTKARAKVLKKLENIKIVDEKNVPKDRKAWETWKVEERDNLERIYKKYKIMQKAWN